MVACQLLRVSKCTALARQRRLVKQGLEFVKQRRVPRGGRLPTHDLIALPKLIRWAAHDSRTRVVSGVENIALLGVCARVRLQRPWPQSR